TLAALDGTGPVHRLVSTYPLSGSRAWGRRTCCRTGTASDKCLLALSAGNSVALQEYLTADKTGDCRGLLGKLHIGMQQVPWLTFPQSTDRPPQVEDLRQCYRCDRDQRSIQEPR